MECTLCGFATDVVNSRHQKRLNQVWRRRHCIRCTSTFTTIEAADLAKTLFVYQGPEQRLEPQGPFLRDKLFLSIYDSVKHRKTALQDATALTQTIISKLYPRPDEPYVHTTEITTAATEVLKRFDTAAATHYQAYHPI